MRSLTLALLPTLVLIAGCDRQSTVNEQANASERLSATADNAGAPVDADVNAVSPDEATAAPTTPEAAGKIDRSHQGAAAPTAAFEMPGGGALTLGAFAQRPFLLNVWATWCGPCKIEMPSLDAIAGGGNLAVVAVSQDLDGAKAVQPFFAQMHLKALKPYTDPKNALGQALGNPSLPTTILYDAKGREVWRKTGGMDWATPEAKALLAEAK
ncbi:TlpA disulfide reductase family protein [Sphingomonas sp.]|uniref:TlpA family protein disulfide reductase n=1 Tax=Sphingomonas sp. TaxID=28214 RepID=UPI0025F42E05|nr:TlpA disulfide reductase family protein [Sphingomonas sp.]